jgi:guanylate kinase
MLDSKTYSSVKVLKLEKNIYPLIVSVSGPSGVGKGAIVNKLLQSNRTWKNFVTSTSRSPRLGEINGVDRHFLSSEEFLKKVSNGDFIEYEEVYPKVFYGIDKTLIAQYLQLKTIILIDIDYKGALKLKNLYNANHMSVFVLPPSLGDLSKRITDRDKKIDSEQLKVRLKKAEEEILKCNLFDYVFTNNTLNDLDRIANSISKIISLPSRISRFTIDNDDVLSQENLVKSSLFIEYL